MKKTKLLTAFLLLAISLATFSNKVEAVTKGCTYGFFISGIYTGNGCTTDNDCYDMLAVWKKNKHPQMNKKQYYTIARYNSENINNKVSVKSINNAMDKVFNKAGKNDTIILYYSGHGADGSLVVRAGTNKNKPVLYQYKDLATKLSKYKARRIIVILDTCHAGSFHSKGVMKVSNKNHNRDRFITFLSCSSYETSQMWSHSRFTTHLIDGLYHDKNNHYADFNKSKAISVKELGDYSYMQLKDDLLRNNVAPWTFQYRWNKWVKKNVDYNDMTSEYHSYNHKEVIYMY